MEAIFLGDRNLDDDLKFNCIALNCCGFTSKMNNGILDNYLSEFDLICLSETKSQHADLKNTALQHSHVAINSDLKNAHNLVGSQGVLVLVKNEYENYVREVEGVSKNVVWFTLDKEVLGKKCIFGAVYIPCEGSPCYDRGAFADLRNDVEQFKEDYHGAPICLLGDFNSRTGRLQDYIAVDDVTTELTGLNDDIIPLPDDLVNVDLKRVNEDYGINKNGKQLIDFCKQQNIRILNGRVGADRGVGKITCHNRNGGKSAVDMVICSPELLRSVSNFEILPMDKDLSDAHCAVYVSFKLSSALETEVEMVGEQCSGMMQGKQRLRIA